MFFASLCACGAEVERPRPAARAPERELVVAAAPSPPRALAEEVARLEDTAASAIAAARAADGAASLCDAAYDSLLAMRDEVAAQYPEDTRPMPARPAFMQICRELPEPAQQCLVASHAVEHIQECAQVQASLSPTQRNRLHDLLAGA